MKLNLDELYNKFILRRLYHNQSIALCPRVLSIVRVALVLFLVETLLEIIVYATQTACSLLYISLNVFF